MATQQYERSVEEAATTSQSQLSNVEADDDEYIDQYLKDLESYEDMGEDQFKYDNLLMGVPRDDESVQPRDADENVPRDDECVEPKRFADAVSEKEILDKIKSAVPRSTKQSTAWSANTWQDWRQSKGEDVPPSLVGINNYQLGYCRSI